MSIDKSLFPEETHGIIDLINSEEWPVAAEQHEVCGDTDADKTERAASILEYAGFDLTGKKVLDFGCGEGHVAAHAASVGATAVGYDIKQSGTLPWEAEGAYLLTTDIEQVRGRGPYDYVIIYDVLDHCQDVAAALNEVKSVCTPATKVFIRFHSWMSKHGVRQYKTLNKGWVQLFFNKDELKLMGIDATDMQQYSFPINTQTNWLIQAGFAIKEKETITGPVPKIVRNDLYKRFYGKDFEQFPKWQASQLYNDYWVALS